MWLIYNIFKWLALLQLLAQSQGGIVQEAKRHIRAEFNDALGHHQSYYGSHWHNGQRVHRLQMPHSHQRWSGRRRSINHPHPFSRWSQWTSCDEDCIRHRERYCRAKRKCGHTKHMEQRKCSHCIPSVKWHEPREQHHFQGNLRHSNPNTPAIIINAAAAASSGPSFQPHRSRSHPISDVDSVEVVHRKPPRVFPIEEEGEEEDDSNYHDDLGDFFVLKRHRKRDRQKPRPNPRQYPRHRNGQKPRPKPRPEYIDDDFEDYLEKRSLTSRQRSLGGLESDSGLEGDVFQYEDFDFDQDNTYGDSDEYSEYRNISSLSPTKERNTPDGMLPRHRRIYSKWSRWTKCSPKCTTRRYKKCRVSEQCGREVLREIAYCYTEGSFCQQWLQTQVQKAPVYEARPGASSGRGGAMRRMHTEPGAGTLSKNDVNVIMSGKGYRGPEYSPLKLHCGIVRNGQRSMYNMLKIIGGKSAKKGDWPWQVAILNRFKEAFCGGTLIAPLWVLTAAHCVRKVLYVRFGEHNLEYEDGTELQLRVKTSYKHPKFDKKTVDSDVALLRLPKPVNSTSWIGFSCLPRPYQPLPRNVECTVIGWGKRRNRDALGTSILQQANLPIIPMDNCRSVYHDYTITKNMFCAGHRRGRIDTCAGDSGGPLLCRDTTKANHPWTIFGITSFGDGCAKRNKFGIYAKVPNYVDWVWSVINCDGNCKFH